MSVTSYKSALVVGLGLSGEAATELLRREGCAVLAVDRGDGDVLEARARRLRAAGAEVRLGVADLAALLGSRVSAAGFEICIVSPGIPVDDEWLRPVRERGIALLSELELGASRCRGALLAVTGSNGKSTCTKLCGEVLARSGLDVALAGNYGIPISSVAMDRRPFDWIVAEVSSFQLETVHRFAPRAAVLLNLQPDHLDRHGDMDTYVGLKARVFDRMGRGSVGVVHDEVLPLVRERTAGQPTWCTFGSGADADYRYRDGDVLYRDGDRDRTVSLRGTVFGNEVTGLTAAAALAVTRAVGGSVAGFESAVRTYEPLPHRMQEVGEKGGIRFIDDSKATNLGALCAALRMVHTPVRLIAGGILKEGGLGNVKEILATTVKRVYLIGQGAAEMESSWGDAVGCTLCCNMDEAVRTAWREAEAGDTILLSPGCASFDQFKDYKDRGERFKKVVTSLVNGKDVDHED